MKIEPITVAFQREVPEVGPRPFMKLITVEGRLARIPHHSEVWAWGVRVVGKYMGPEWYCYGVSSPPLSLHREWHGDKLGDAAAIISIGLMSERKRYDDYGSEVKG